MSEFLDLYREKKMVEAQMRKLRKKPDLDEFLALKDKKEKLSEKLDKIIEEDKKITKSDIK